MNLLRILTMTKGAFELPRILRNGRNDEIKSTATREDIHLFFTTTRQIRIPTTTSVESQS